MPVEIEAKMQIESPQPVVERLRALGARFRGDFHEVNTFFDTEDRRLLAADQGLRMRVSRNAASGEEQVLFTHKGPAQQGAVKRRDETELEVGSALAAARLVENLGFGRTMSFEK